MADELNGLIVSEVLADSASGSALDIDDERSMAKAARTRLTNS